MWIEKRKLLALWRAAQAAGEEVAMATVVRVEGSSYRRPGATMLLTRSGRRVGMVSGGCLEAEVSKKIWWLTEGGPCVETYDTSFDEEGRAAYGLGCGGRISLLLERGGTAGEKVEAIRRSVEERTASAVMTVIEHGPVEGAAQVGRRFVVGPSEDGVEEVLKDAAAGVFERRSSEVMVLPLRAGPVTVFAEYAGPPPRLFVFGAGDDAQPVSELAAALGWEVVVADGRAQLATAARFPSAHRVIVLTPERWPELGIGRSDAAVILTHSYEQDRGILLCLLPLDLSYVGVLGPRRRTVRLVEEICGEVGAGVSESLAKLHSPAGLDLGADGPEAIALSIIAEVQATFEGRSALPLHRMLAGAIHA